MTTLDEICETAACAATAGNIHDRENILRALEGGARAAQHGCAIPLPILIDVYALLAGSHSVRPAYRRSDARRPLREEQEYDGWLSSFFSAATKVLRQRRSRQARPAGGGSAAAPLRDCLALLIEELSDKTFSLEQPPHAYADAYAAILSSPALVDAIYGHWSGRRSGDAAKWSWWPAHKVSPDITTAPAAGIWSLYSTSLGSQWLHEKFDHWAADFYLHGEDTVVKPDQAVRIMRLLHRLRRHVSVPFSTAFEVQDPNFGAITLSTLTLGEYGDFKIVQGSYPKITDPPARRPPQAFHLHLCYALGFAGLTAGQEGGFHPRPPSDASALQGFVALLLDDWREALEVLPVEFSLHRGWPDPDGAFMGRGGTRWKELTRRGGHLPPSALVKLAFPRQDYVNLSAQAPEWDVRHVRRSLTGKAGGEWWCGVAAASDLEEFGFAPVVRPHGDLSPCPSWRAEVSLIPESISHLVVIEKPSSSGGGSLYHIRKRGARGSGGELWQLTHRHRPSFGAGEFDTFLLDLRCHALDVLLDILEARMF